MKRLGVLFVSLLSGLFLINQCYGMAVSVKSPPKGITLRSVTGISYSLRESIKRATTGIEICDFWGLSLNGRLGFAFEGDTNPRYIIDVDYNLKQFPELAESLNLETIFKPVIYLVDLCNKIPAVELSGGVGFGCNDNFEEKGIEFTATVIRVNW